MNHPAVLTIAGHLDSDQQRVIDLTQRAQATVSTLGQNWFGNDSSQFSSDWANRSKQLLVAGEVLAAMSKHARAQATDQQSTSAG